MRQPDSNPCGNNGLDGGRGMIGPWNAGCEVTIVTESVSAPTPKTSQVTPR